MSEDFTRKPHLRRNDPDVKANDALRIVSDPAVVREFEQMEREIIEQIVVAPDGTDESIEMERELCRQLRTMRRLRTGLQLTPQLQTLREAEYRSVTDTEETDEKAPEPYKSGIAKTERFK